jgi:HSP20 family protein
MDNDNDFFANPFRSLMDPRFTGTSLMTGANFPHMGGLGGLGSLQDTAPIKLDVLEKEDRFVVKADVPGIPKERVHLSVDGDLLNLSIDNETAQERDEHVQGYKIHRSERSTSFARRVIRLPDSADTERITAHVEHGVLGVDIPKKHTAHQRRRQIDIGGGVAGGPTQVSHGIGVSHGTPQTGVTGVPQSGATGVSQSGIAHPQQ